MVELVAPGSDALGGSTLVVERQRRTRGSLLLFMEFLFFFFDELNFVGALSIPSLCVFTVLLLLFVLSINRIDSSYPHWLIISWLLFFLLLMDGCDLLE